MAKKAKSSNPDPTPSNEGWSPDRPMGLARALNKAGWGTRRQVEEWIHGGRLTVDDEVVTDPLHPLTTESKVRVPGRDLTPDRRNYYAFHKPPRVICGPGDPGGLKHVGEYFPAWVPGLRAAGRMDGRTTGLMLVSNDPAWNNRIVSVLRPEQEFRVQVEGVLGDLEVSVLSAGIHLPGLGIFRPLSVRVIEKLNQHTVLNIVLREGKVRQIRRMFTTLRHKIILLRRIRVGEIRLGDLPSGGVRPLTEPEIRFIRESAPPPEVDPDAVR